MFSSRIHSNCSLTGGLKVSVISCYVLKPQRFERRVANYNKSMSQNDK